MSNQVYQDFTLIFGPPSGDFYDHIIFASQKTGEPRCKIYEEWFWGIIDNLESEGFLSDIFSKIVGEKLTIGEIFRTKQVFYSGRPDLDKLRTNPDEKIHVPALMFFPSRFQTPCDEPIGNVLTPDHLGPVAAILGQTLRLDWVQSIATNFSEKKL